MKRNMTVTLFVLLMVFIATAARASTVIVTGSGPTVDSALRDCMRTAVEQTIGVYVDAKTLVEKNTVLQDSIYANSKGYISNYKVINTVKTADGYKLTAQIDVDSNPDSELMSSLQKLNIINVGLGNPRIAVLVNDGVIDNSVTESAIENVLGNEGFRIVATAINSKDLTRSRLRTRPGSSLSSNDVANVMKNVKTSSVDYLILGVTNVKDAGDIGGYGMYTAKGSGSFKIIRVDTGDIIASNNFTATALDISGSAAVDKACDNLGQSAAGFVRDKLLSYAANPLKTVQVTVNGVSDFNSLQKIQSSIAAFRGVNAVQINQFSNNSAVMTVSGSITAMDLVTYAGSLLPELTLASVSNAAVIFNVG